MIFEKSDKEYELQALIGLDFHVMIGRARKLQGITLEELASGLCSRSMMARIESGERCPSYAMQNRLTARLGISDDGFCHMLFAQDYEEYRDRERLLDAIESGAYQDAEMLLAKQEGQTNCVEHQFYLVMQAQLCQTQGADEEKLASLYQQALSQTIVRLTETPLQSLCLSVQELDIILEYVKHAHLGRLAECALAVIAYLEMERINLYSRVRLYPKAVCYLYQSGQMTDRRELLRRCNTALQLLRDAGRTYYLWELLEIRLDCLSILREPALDWMVGETRHWQEALGLCYELCGLSPYMRSSCYLYRQKDIYCLNDVIRIRREMLGMTKKELCSGICSEKTIGRLERHEMKMQLAIVRELLVRLHLPSALNYAQLLTDDVQIYRLTDKEAHLTYKREWNKAVALLQSIQERTQTTYVMNRQYLRIQTLMIQSAQRLVNDEDMVKQLVETLECSLPLEVAMKDTPKYLTWAEYRCLVSIMIHCGEQVRNVYMRLLMSLCKHMEDDGSIRNDISRWELCMTDLASLYGNMAQYDKSNEIDLRTMQECLKNNRMNYLGTNLYDMAWNHQQKQENQDTVRYLRNSMYLAQLNKNTNREKWLKEKIDNFGH